ncbi:MAG: hypothetical protein Ct9H300mP28_28880 [Pseudomonadota bacterium]|nr:MAG: hypothetical protein Ct9H300mP28_28880 [Pseudomonadota bacterium]
MNRVREFSGLQIQYWLHLKKPGAVSEGVTVNISEDVELLKDRDIFILDDMVRTGGTIAANISAIAESEKMST